MKCEGMGRWDDSTYLKFIHLYERHKCLWKTNCSSYKSRAARDVAIRRVVEGMEIPDFRKLDCKNKIKNIRSHYCQELKKIYDSKRLSAPGEVTYEPKLAWFASLDCFLRPHVQISSQNNTAENTAAHVLAKPTEETREGEDGNDLDDNWSSSTAERVTEQTVNDDGPSEQVFCEVLAPEERPSKKRKTGDFADVFPVTSCPVADDEGATKATERKESEFEAFGKSVAAQLNNMAFPDALQLQLQIQTLITDERLKILRASYNPLL